MSTAVDSVAIGTFVHITENETETCMRSSPRMATT
jgi:hypothetical protein